MDWSLIVGDSLYVLWRPDSERRFAELVIEHIRELFGEDAIYFDMEPLLRSKAGIGSKPDGLIIILSDRPKWYVIEFELARHPAHEHIVKQMLKFTCALNDFAVKSSIIEALYNNIKSDEFKKQMFSKRGVSDIHYFISSLIMHNEPELVIIIDEEKDELDEALKALIMPIKVIVFKTFLKDRSSLKDHVHLFTPIIKLSAPPKNFREFWAELLNRLYTTLPNVPRREPSDDSNHRLHTGTSWPISSIHFEW